jgi:hypothetical protein
VFATRLARHVSDARKRATASGSSSPGRTNARAVGTIRSRRFAQPHQIADERGDVGLRHQSALDQGQKGGVRLVDAEQRDLRGAQVFRISTTLPSSKARARRTPRRAPRYRPDCRRVRRFAG